MTAATGLVPAELLTLGAALLQHCATLPTMFGLLAVRVTTGPTESKI